MQGGKKITSTPYTIIQSNKTAPQFWGIKTAICVNRFLTGATKKPNIAVLIFLLQGDHIKPSRCAGVRVIVSTASVRAYSLCVARTSVCARWVCVCVCVCARTLARLCVSPWLQCECGVFAEDTGTRSPAGEGDEAQLGIIKPSAVSMQGPRSQPGPVSPRLSSLDWDCLHHTTVSPFAVFPPGSEGRGANATAARRRKCVWTQPRRHGSTLLSFP